VWEVLRSHSLCDFGSKDLGHSISIRSCGRSASATAAPDRASTIALQWDVASEIEGHTKNHARALLRGNQNMPPVRKAVSRGSIETDVRDPSVCAASSVHQSSTNKRAGEHCRRNRSSYDPKAVLAEPPDVDATRHETCSDHHSNGPFSKARRLAADGRDSSNVVVLTYNVDTRVLRVRNPKQHSSVDQYQAGLDNGGGHNHVPEDPKPEQELMAF
jgi:hypothetical protein